MKITFKSEERKKVIYVDYSNVSSECFKGDFVPSICQENMITQTSRKSL